MKSSLLKLNKYLKKTSTDKYSTNGKIFIDFKLNIGKELILTTDSKKQPVTNRKSDAADNTNLDWQRMYTHSDRSVSPLNDYHSAGVGLSTHYNDTPSTSLVEYSMPEKNFIQGIVSFLGSKYFPKSIMYGNYSLLSLYHYNMYYLKKRTTRTKT